MRRANTGGIPQISVIGPDSDNSGTRYLRIVGERCESVASAVHQRTSRVSPHTVSDPVLKLVHQASCFTKSHRHRVPCLHVPASSDG